LYGKRNPEARKDKTLQSVTLRVKSEDELNNSSLRE